MFLTSLLGTLRFGAGRAGPGGPYRPGRNALAARRMRLEPLEERVLLSVAPEWVLGMTITGAYDLAVVDTAVGPDGDVYVGGRFHETADFDPNVDHSDEGDPDILTSAGASDGFVARYTSEGDFGWARAMGTSGGGESAGGIDVDIEGNIYVTGQLSGTAQFGDDMLGPGGYVTRLDSDGAFDWAVTAASSEGHPYSYDITVDDSDPNSPNWSVYVVGAGAGQVGDQPDKSGHGYVLKLKADEATGGESQFIWTQLIDGTHVAAVSIALDPPAGADEASLYLTGSFRPVATFGDITLRAASEKGSAEADIFVAKMDTEGNFLWAERMGGVGGDYGGRIAIDDGSAYVTGRFGHAPAEFGDFTLTPEGTSRAFVEKLDSDGNVLWARQISSDHSGGN